MIGVPSLPPDPTLDQDLHVGTEMYRALTLAFAPRDTGLTAFGVRVFVDETLPPGAWELRPAR